MEGHKPVKHLVQSSGHLSLKMVKYWENLESEAELSGPMKNSLVSIRLIHLVHLLHLGNKTNGGRSFSVTGQDRATEYFKDKLMAIVQIDLAQQKV
jgi:hypothetical protein